MAITLLGCFYNDINKGKADSISSFVQAIKAVTAFYILWRASESNAGLDNAYRVFFKGSTNESGRHWLNTKGQLDIKDLKSYFKTIILSRIGVEDKSSWVNKASNFLKYDSPSICRIALLIYFHDTIPDPATPGLNKKGMAQSSPYLRLIKMISDDLKDIEHIAPKDNSGSWDNELYEPKARLYDSIGNLTLLPSSINISASNKGWKEKYIYYQHLGTKDLEKAQELLTKAQVEGISLNASTLELLRNSNYNEHILPLLTIGENESWNKDIVEKRGKQIMEVVWDTVIKWLD